jgi:hypothetical protein
MSQIPSISFEYCNQNLYITCHDEEEKLASKISHMFSIEEKGRKIISTLGGLDKVRIVCTSTKEPINIRDRSELESILELLKKHKYISDDEEKKLCLHFQSKVTTKITM